MSSSCTVLCARRKSSYFFLVKDVYDEDRDMNTYNGDSIVICHPPCRAWGRLKHMARPKDGEKELAIKCVGHVRANGGVLEHPIHSSLWKDQGLPKHNEGVDEYGGFTILIDQFDFGHIAHKPTWLYIKGCKESDIPALPPKRLDVATHSIAGSSKRGGVKGTKCCSRKTREATPILLIKWLLDLVDVIANSQ